MTVLAPFVRSNRCPLIVFVIWIGLAALVAGSACYVRWIPLLLSAVWLLFTAGIILWAIVGLIDRLWGTANADDAVASGSYRTGRAFRSAVALWIILSGIYCFLAFIDDDILFFTALGSLPLIVFWVGVVVWSSVLAAMRLWSHAYRPALRAALVLPLATGVIFYGQDVGDVVRFEIERPSYIAAIAAARGGRSDNEHVEIDVGPPMVAYFPWGGFLSVSYGVVFDETDQMVKPVAARREAWADRGVPVELKCEGGVLAVGGHFYVGRFSC